MSFQLVDFQEILSDSESEVDFTAERMTNKLVDIDTSLQLDDEALLRFVDDNKAKNTVKKTKSDMNLWQSGTSFIYGGHSRLQLAANFYGH